MTILYADELKNQAFTEEPIMQRFVENLPPKPYCTDVLGSRLQILPAVKALTRRYIQPNSPFDLRWLVYDIDSPTAVYDWDDAHAPAPNIFVMNKENGHAHLLYGLKVPVYKQPAARQAPLRYVAAIDVALSLKLQADPGYAGLICKNPVHPYWYVVVFKEVLYDLEWLADYLDLSPYRDRRCHLPPIGLRRNCTLFEVTRRWAYSHIRKQDWTAGDFITAVTEYARTYNAERFPVPLPWAEVKATGKSIGKWTFKNMSSAGFKAWGDARREKSIIVRQSKSQERAIEIKAFKAAHPDMSNRMIAEVLGIPETTLRRLLGQ